MLKFYIIHLTKIIGKIVNHFNVEDFSWIKIELPPIVLQRLLSQNQQSTSV